MTKKKPPLGDNNIKKGHLVDQYDGRVQIADSSIADKKLLGDLKELPASQSDNKVRDAALGAAQRIGDRVIETDPKIEGDMQASHVDQRTKKCPFCAEEIKKEAIVCRYCGRDVTTNMPEEVPKFYKNPSIAALLSCFFMGLGQLYNGQIVKGILYIILYAISLGLMSIVIGFITTPIFWILGMVDAYDSAKRINQELSES